MASPWKLLARLVSPRRRQRQEHGSTDDVKPDLLAIANLTETAADNGLNTEAPPVDAKPVADEQSEAVSADPDHSDETAHSIHGTADSEDARPAERLIRPCPMSPVRSHAKHQNPPRLAKVLRESAGN